MSDTVAKLAAMMEAAVLPYHFNVCQLRVLYTHWARREVPNELLVRADPEWQWPEIHRGLLGSTDFRR